MDWADCDFCNSSGSLAIFTAIRRASLQFSRASSRNWTWKVEGLYMDLGTLDATGAISSASVLTGFAVIGPEQVTTRSHFTDGILRGGPNYKFY